MAFQRRRIRPLWNFYFITWNITSSELSDSVSVLILDKISQIWYWVLFNPQFLLLLFHGLDLSLFPFLDLYQELLVLFQALLQALDMIDQALIGRVAIPFAALDFGGDVPGTQYPLSDQKICQPIQLYPLVSYHQWSFLWKFAYGFYLWITSWYSLPSSEVCAKFAHTGI